MSVDRREAASLIAWATLVAPAGAASGDATLSPVRLQVEWGDRPVGIDRLRPRFSWQLASATRDARQSAYRVIVSATPDAGQGDVWDSGVVAGEAQLARPPRDLPLQSHHRYWWSVRCADARDRWSDWASAVPFVTGMISPADWQAAWIAAVPDRTLPPHRRGQASRDMVPARPLPIFRRGVLLDAAPRSAIISVAGLGQHALAINGHAIGQAALTPGWTDYRRTVLYDTHDVTDLLRAGPNALALMLGNGMYNVEYREGRYTKFLDSFGQPKAILALTIDTADGRRLRIVSDGAWRAHEGPVRFSSIYGGEDVDARCDPPGWRMPGFDDSGWTPACVVGGPGGGLRAASVPPVVCAEAIVPVAITEPAAGVLLVDFGCNFSGRPAIEIEAAPGDTVVLTPAETLDAHGRADQRSFNAGPGKRVEFRYVAAGSGRERFEARFTYHGFRYIEVTGVPRAAIRAIEGRFLHAAIPRAGSFDTREAGLRAIHRLIDQAVSSNMVSVLTDCPHREKLGWLEQTWLNAPTVLYNRAALPLYEKLVRDIAEAQQPDGMIPGIAPEYVAFVDRDGHDQIWRNSPEWGVAAVLAPWAAYRFHGDRSILIEAWPAAARYCDYLARRSVDGLLDFGMGDWFDIGPNEPGEAQLTSRVLTGTAVHVEALAAMARIAPMVGRDQEVAGYRARAADVAAALNRRFLDRASGRYDRGSQTAMAMSLALGIVPPALRARATALLVAAVRAGGDAVTAGDIGFRYVIAALVRAGRDDVVLDMLRVRDRPSYAYQIARGATALTEAWNADPTKSLNHFMLGHAEGWLYGRLAGLRIDHSLPGAAAFTIAPVVMPSVGGAAAHCHTNMGPFACRWAVDGRRLTIEAVVPAGRRATIMVPGVRAGSLREGGVALAGAVGIRIVRPAGRDTAVEVGSGHYRITGERHGT